MEPDFTESRPDTIHFRQRRCLDSASLAALARGEAPDELITFAAFHLPECDACRSAFDALSIFETPHAHSVANDSLAKWSSTGTGDTAPGYLDPDPHADFGPRFRTLRILGAGGMGTVYQCFDNRLGRDIALKALKTDKASRQFVERMEREARIQASLSHPDIVATHEAGVFAGQPAIVMEFIAGQSLKKTLADRTLAPQEAARLVARIAHSLHHAHEKGVLHRDLKPANILLQSDNKDSQPQGVLAATPKIADFGLAKLIDDDSDLTHTDLVVGTPAYSSPEQISGRRHGIDRRSDIYSLGCVLYECLTGRPPFQANSLARISAMIESAIPLSPRQIDPSISRDIETICLKCLEKDPAQRYPTSASLAENLEAFVDGRPIQARPTPAPLRVWRWCRRNRGITAGLAVSAVSLSSLTIGALLFASSQANLRRIASENGYKAVRQSEIAEQARLLADQQRDQARLLFVASSRVLHDIGNMLNLARIAKPSAESNQKTYVEFQKRLLDLSDLYLKRTDLEDDSPDMLPLSIYNAARAHATLGNDSEAIRHFEWLIDLNGKKPPTEVSSATYRHLVTAGRLELSEIYARLGQKEKSIALLQPFWERPVDPVTGQPVDPGDRGFRQLRICFGEKLRSIYYDMGQTANYEAITRDIESVRQGETISTPPSSEAAASSGPASRP